MIKSMTGYGRAEKESRIGKVVVEISTTNRRYLEISLGLPRELAAFEQEFRELVSRFLKRGRVQVHVDFQPAPDKMEFLIDVDLAKKYAEALQTLCGELGLKDEITLKDILAYKDILSFERISPDGDKIRVFLSEALTEALQALSKMRETEGASLQGDMMKRLSLVEVKVKEIESLAPLAVNRYEVRLRKKLDELLSDTQGNEERILREVAVMAERLDITEEIVRLRSHIQQFSGSMESDDVVGRLLDFLVQEMVREINTIASKSNDLDISRLTVEIRNELDKMREQIQNIE